MELVLQIREDELEVRRASCPLEPVDAAAELIGLVQVSLGASDYRGVMNLRRRRAAIGGGT